MEELVINVEAWLLSIALVIGCFIWTDLMIKAIVMRSPLRLIIGASPMIWMLYTSIKWYAFTI